MAAQENNNPEENKQRKWVKIIENYPQDTQIFSGDKSLDKLKLSNKVLLRERNAEVAKNPDFDVKQIMPDYAKCIKVSTDASLYYMIAPGLMVILVPIVGGILFGSAAVEGILAGSIVSGVQVAISASNTGGAWDNAKKFVEKGNFGGKGTDTHSATVVGDTVGDPFKDTSGPAMNILINVMAIVSLVIAPLL